jgi:hypothetical protein
VCELAREGLLAARNKVAECTGLFVSKLTPTSPAAVEYLRLTHYPVGASLLAKAYLQPGKKVAECTGLFASKVERHSGHSHNVLISDAVLRFPPPLRTR